MRSRPPTDLVDRLKADAKAMGLDLPKCRVCTLFARNPAKPRTIVHPVPAPIRYQSMNAVGPTPADSARILTAPQRVQGVDADRRRDPSEQRDERTRQPRDTLDLHPTEEPGQPPATNPVVLPKPEEPSHLDLRG